MLVMLTIKLKENFYPNLKKVKFKSDILKKYKTKCE